MVEPRRYTLDVLGRPLTPNERRRSSWPVQARDTRSYRSESAVLARAQHSGPPLARAHVAATLYRARGRALDIDAAYGTLKPLLDGLVGVLIVDDSPAHITLDVRQDKAERRSVRLEITEVLDADAG